MRNSYKGQLICLEDTRSEAKKLFHTISELQKWSNEKVMYDKGTLYNLVKNKKLLTFHGRTFKVSFVPLKKGEERNTGNGRLHGKRRKNIYRVYRTYAVILIGHGTKVYIDKEDVDMCKKYTWSIGNKNTVVNSKTSKTLPQYLFPNSKRTIKHIDGNPLNNRRSNLTERTGQAIHKKRGVYHSTKFTEDGRPLLYISTVRTKKYVRYIVNIRNTDGSRKFVAFKSLDDALDFRDSCLKKSGEDINKLFKNTFRV